MQLQLARQRRGHVPGAANSILFAVLPALITLTATAAGQQQCTRQQGTCIIPDPQPPPFALGKTSLDESLFELKCELICISRYAPEAEVINENSAWPTYNMDFSNNCGLENKVLGCKQGCMEHFNHPSMTVNRCRDSCYQTCMDAEGEPSLDEECPLQCRKTYCRFGCLLYESLTNDNVTFLPQAPSDGPEVVAKHSVGTCSRSRQEVVFDLPSQVESSSSAYSQQDAVGFLLKVSSQNGNSVRYILQHSLNQSLDFTSLACQQISLSYAVVTESTSLSSLVFSPETTVCIPGLDAYPSQVNQSAMLVSFTEDFREGFFGYSVANLSWQRPLDYECISSYRINVYPDRLECGGVDQQEQPAVSFININRTLTSFLFKAKEANGFIKFGCSYTFEIESLPVPGVQVGPRITRSADLSNTPSMEVECKRIFGPDGHFNVSVTTHLFESQPTTHISQFTITSEILTNEVTTKTLGEDSIIPQEGSDEFVKVLSYNFAPLTNESQTVKVQITADKKEEYYWRKVPRAQECSISLDPISPEPVKDILLENIRYLSSSRWLQFDLSWTPPTAYGQLTEYDLIVLNSDDRDLLLSGHSVDTLSPHHRESINPQVRELRVNASVNVSTYEHCLYLKIRAKNSYQLFSSWSSAVVLPLDGQCVVAPPSPLGNVSVPIDQEGATISVFYEADDGSRVRLLDVGCEANPGSSEQNIHSRLEGIEARMDAVLSQLNAEQEAFARLSHLQAKLTDIEQKLDALMNLVTTHVYT